MRCEDIGLEVEQTRNLLNASLRTAKRLPDIICVDVQKPTGNGLSFCEALAADRETTQASIIVLTGKTDFETRQACKRLGAYYVEKNVDYWSTLEPILRRLATETPAETGPSDIELISQESPTGLARPVSKIEIPERSSQPNIKHILVADDDEDMVKMLMQRCTSLGCSVIGVNNAFDAISEIHRCTPDLVCLDVVMPSGDGLSVCEMVASDEQLKKIPIIILTGRSDESTIRRCHDMMMYYVEKSANTWERVEPLVRELLHLDESIAVANSVPRKCSPVVPVEANSGAIDRQDLVDAVFAVLGAGHSGKSAIPSSDQILFGREEIPWVLCIDDDEDFADALKIRLEDHGVAVIRAHSGMEGYRLAFTAPANAILLDFNMPNGQGDYILGRLKDNPVTRDIPVVIITGGRDKMLERRMLAMGATAFFVKPVGFDQLREHLSKYIDILRRSEDSLVTATRRKKSHPIIHHISKPD
jgi:CheY-like chemotaxis protein